MTWLSSWLKEIIMVVLLASFVDLILPSRSMERYVKLVLSLLILLTLLSPLIKLLTDAADIKLAGAFNRFNQQSAAGGSKGSLQQIMEQAQQLKNQQNQQSLEWAAREIAAQMQEQIRKQNGQNTAEVSVILGMDGMDRNSGADQNPYIKGVTVVLRPEDEAAAKQGGVDPEPGQDIRIDPVKPVQVEVQMDQAQGDSKSTKASSGKEGGSTPGSKSNDKAEAIKKMLGNTWGLEPETIIVQDGSAGDQKL
ncbi:stage III sporulation protein AF [Paenibacillus chibensis]|uniref:Stage III sporulation protein AF n=1 Tax=Paenibacillus chibensis TaxID=59846 RepID=A0ABU6PRQ5_9BACL|nr:stage III sporulation protein AF [Paenibacillus chibensis]